MRRYWVPLSSIKEELVILEGDVFHHICNVCRMGMGAKFEVLVEGGQAFFVEIIELGKKKARAQILESRKIDPLRKPYIHLGLCFPRPSVFEAILEKAVELGVQSITPILSDYSYWKKKSEVILKKRERWQKIILSATQQSGRGELLQLESPRSLEEVLEEINQNDNAVGLFPYEGDATHSLRESLARESIQDCENIWIFVGGEGGFSQREVELFKTFDLDSVTLGPQVLRVETACVALVSVIKYHLDLMK